MKGWIFVALVASACAASPAVTEGRRPDVEAPSDARMPLTASVAAVIPASEAWRQKPPGTGIAPRPHPVELKSVRLENGLVLYVSEEHRLPIVDVAVALRGGSALDPPMRPGLTSLMLSMMEANADAFALKMISADMRGATAKSYVYLSIEGFAKDVDEMGRLIARAVTKPVFDERFLKRRKELISQNLVARRGSLNALAGEYLHGIVFGADHPYGHPPEGTPESIAAADISEVRAQWQRTVTPERAALVIVGDISLAGAKQLALKHFAAWRPVGGAAETTAKRMKPVPPVEAKPRRVVTILDRVNVSQTVVCIGRALPGAREPDELPLKLANQFYGGGVGSRLQMNLRESKGITYGASSCVEFDDGAGQLVACSNVKRKSSAEALAEFMRELETMRQKPVGDEEIDAVIDAFPLQIARGLDSIQSIANLAIYVFATKRPIDYWNRIAVDVRALKAEKVRDAVKRYLDPNKMQVLVVGDASQIRADIEALGLGQIVLLRR
jgi:predicted Zn-dependent peptidase